MTFDAKAFAHAGYEVVPSANGGVILAGEEQNLAFTTPADFVEWLRDVYGLKSQEHEAYRQSVKRINSLAFPMEEGRDWLTNVLVRLLPDKSRVGGEKSRPAPAGLAPKLKENEFYAYSDRRWMPQEEYHSSLCRSELGE